MRDFCLKKNKIRYMLTPLDSTSKNKSKVTGFSFPVDFYGQTALSAPTYRLFKEYS